MLHYEDGRMDFLVCDGNNLAIGRCVEDLCKIESMVVDGLLSDDEEGGSQQKP